VFIVWGKFALRTLCERSDYWTSCSARIAAVGSASLLRSSLPKPHVKSWTASVCHRGLLLLNPPSPQHSPTISKPALGIRVSADPLPIATTRSGKCSGGPFPQILPYFLRPPGFDRAQQDLKTPYGTSNTRSPSLILAILLPVICKGSLGWRVGGSRALQIEIRLPKCIRWMR
jgi:hypothetical protein